MGVRNIPKPWWEKNLEADSAAGLWDDGCQALSLLGACASRLLQPDVVNYNEAGHGELQGEAAKMPIVVLLMVHPDHQGGPGESATQNG